MMKVDVIWKGNMAFQADAPSGHRVMMDAQPKAGEGTRSQGPMETLLAAAGACSGIDIVMILERMRFRVDAFSMEVSGERAEDHPRRFTRFTSITGGGDLPPEKVRRAVELSRDKYCSVLRSLNAEVTTSFSINGVEY